MPPEGRRRAYGVVMTARVGGRSTAASWIVGILCAAVIAGLIWLSLPAGPGMLAILGDLLDGGARG
ncbi:hypothetical protein GCM10022383_18020 [Microbacterium soli]|uniref:Uncharacterized protein n=2 Tax=Microbacterium soli TaxID=446075 RepID=A0ABP7N9J6_9MICO